MNKRQLRLYLKWSLPANIALFVLALLDFIFWDSVAMIAILSIYALFLVGVLVILIIDETPPFQRLEFEDPDPGPKTIIYGRP